MVAFIKKYLRFFCLFYGILILLILLSNYWIAENANFKLEPNITSIILGNSHPECAYNDSLISNFKNLSRPAETYFYNYQKLKKVLEQNPQIENIYVEFSTPNILIREDQKIWRDEFISHSLPIYFSFIEIQDHFLLLQKNPVAYQQIALKSLTNNLTRIINNNFSYGDKIGHYKYLKRENLKPNEDTLNEIVVDEILLNDNQLSSYDIKYLKKMIALCHQKNKNIFLIRSPYHKSFSGNAYETSFNTIRNTRFKNIPFIDFKDFPITNEEFGDLHHLNYKGARKFSKWFNTWLNNQNTNENNFYEFMKSSNKK